MFGLFPRTGERELSWFPAVWSRFVLATVPRHHIAAGGECPRGTAGGIHSNQHDILRIIRRGETHEGHYDITSYSFGQTFNVTPLELIRAQAACINGGYLYEPLSKSDARVRCCGSS